MEELKAALEAIGFTVQILSDEPGDHRLKLRPTGREAAWYKITDTALACGWHRNRSYKNIISFLSESEKRIQDQNKLTHHLFRNIEIYGEEFVETALVKAKEYHAHQ